MLFVNKALNSFERGLKSGKKLCLNKGQLYYNSSVPDELTHFRFTNQKVESFIFALTYRLERVI
jgi:hypothetical protein